MGLQANADRPGSISKCLYCEQQPRKSYYYYDLLDDELLNSLKTGCLSGEVITVGYKDDYNAQKSVDNKKNYDAFIARLKGGGLTVKPREPKEQSNWHAKVAIRMNGEEPLAALIGSSNLTRPAYAQGEDIYGDSWNRECDTLIYVPSLALYFDGIQREIGQRFGFMDLVLNPEKEQPDEASQLVWLRDKIITTTKEYNPET